MPGAQENAQVAIDEEVPIINTSLGKCDAIAQQVHDYGGVVMATVTNDTHAQIAVDCGVDALMVTGYEAAAHGSDVGSMVLIPCLAEQFPQVPIVAAGGFARGHQLSAALTLGADGIAMGTRLAMSRESTLAIRDEIVHANQHDTLYGDTIDGIPARVLKTPRSQQQMRQRPNVVTVLYRALQASSQFNVPWWKVVAGLWANPTKIYALAQFGAATQQFERATVSGDLDQGIQFVGQCQGLIHDSNVSVEDIIQATLTEAHETSQRSQLYFATDKEEEHIAAAQ